MIIPRPSSLNPVQGEFKLRAAIASKAMEHIAGEAFGMNSYQRRRSGHIAQTQHYRLFHAGWILAFKAENAEVPETAGKIRFSYFDELKFGADSHQVIENPRF